MTRNKQQVMKNQLMKSGDAYEKPDMFTLTTGFY